METQLVTITAGKGPAECCRVVARVLKLFLAEARDAGINYQIIDEQAGEQPATYQSVILALEGPDLKAFKTTWNGTIQWIGTSEYRQHHKRKNWFVAVHFREQDALNQMEMNELKIQSMRSGGKGGQHVNKVSTAVRVTHLPSGISVTCSEQRSQMQNKKIALQKMQLKLRERQLEEASQRAGDDRKNKILIQRGNPIRVIRGKEIRPDPNDVGKSFSKRRRELKRNLNIELNNMRL